WSIVPNPSPGDAYNRLFAVTAVSASDVWAVGYYSIRNSPPDQTLVEHWDGLAWSVVYSPSPAGYTYSLWGVSALSSHHIWAVRGMVSGQSGGGTGEPGLPPEDRPYFRPSNYATRGQISKIVSETARYGDPAGEQVFEDVPPDSTFYEWIQRLAHRGIMSGYT